MDYKTIEEINREAIEQNVDTHWSISKNKGEIKNILKKLKTISEKIQKISNLKDFLDENYNTWNEEYKEEIIAFINKIKNGIIKQITKKNKPCCLDREDSLDFIENIAQFNKNKFEEFQKTKEEEIEGIRQENDSKFSEKEEEIEAIRQENDNKLTEKEEEIRNIIEDKNNTEKKLDEFKEINVALQEENELRRLHKLAESFEKQKKVFDDKLKQGPINKLILFALIPSLLSVVIFFLNLWKFHFRKFNFGEIDMKWYNYLPFITMTWILIYGIVFYMKNYSTNQKIATIFANKEAIADSITTLLKFLNEDKIDNLDPKEKEELQKQFVSQASNILYRDIDFNDDNKLPIDNISEIVKEVIKKIPINTWTNL